VGWNGAGDQIVIDGEDVALGVRPMEALLAALGICTALDIVSILAKRRTPVESYRIELKGSAPRSTSGGTHGFVFAIS
jgi:putative redox protein